MTTLPVMALIMSGLLLLIPSYEHEQTTRLLVVSVVNTNTKNRLQKKTNTNTKTNNLDHEWCAPLIPLSEQTKRLVVVSVIWWPATSHRTRANELLTSHANPYKNREIQIQIQIYSITNVKCIWRLSLNIDFCRSLESKKRKLKLEVTCWWSFRKTPVQGSAEVKRLPFVLPSCRLRRPS